MNDAQRFLLDNNLNDILINSKEQFNNWVYVSDLMIAFHEKQVKNNVAKSNVIESSYCECKTSETHVCCDGVEYCKTCDKLKN